MVKQAHKPVQPEWKASHKRRAGPARLLRVCIDERAKWHGEHLYEAIEGILDDGLIVISDAHIVRLVRGRDFSGESHVK